MHLHMHGGAARQHKWNQLRDWQWKVLHWPGEVRTTRLRHKLATQDVMRDQHCYDGGVEHKIQHGLAATQGAAKPWRSKVDIDQVLHA
jgi:hypothetical protein